MYVPQYTPSIQVTILGKTPTKLRYVERYVFLKEVKNQNLLNFELGSQERMIVPVWIIIGLQRRDKQDSQNMKIDSFDELPATSAYLVRKTILMLGFYYLMMMIIIVKVMLKLKKLSELQQKRTSFNHI